jgi:hypothetical protein
MKLSRPRKPQRTKTAAAAADHAAENDLIVPNDAASASFVQALVARGQAARPDPNGYLPSGATHEIVGQTEGGLPILRRRRFA